MPYKHTNLLIKREDDKRVKLSDEQKKEIKELYGKVSQRKLAEMYGVSRRLIIFIGCPEKKEQNLLARKLSCGSKQYYNKDKWRETMRHFRKRKQELYLQNKLITKEEN